MQNTESNYLIKLKIAIDKAKHVSESMSKEKNDIKEGWEEAVSDLSYASECGELASRQHIETWSAIEEISYNGEDYGYSACISYIKYEMNKGNS